MRAALAVAAMLVTAACGSPRSPVTPGAPQPETSVTATASTSPSPCAPVEGGSDSAHMFLKDVRAAAHDGFDRVVFELETPDGVTPAIPRYSLKRASPPFTEEPTGEPMTVAGDAFLHLNLQGASGVDLSGETYRQVYKGPRELTPNLTVLRELEEQGDFEATINWVFGLNRDTCPTITTLSGPYRIVIDLPHAE